VRSGKSAERPIIPLQRVLLHKDLSFSTNSETGKEENNHPGREGITTMGEKGGVYPPWEGREEYTHRYTP